jgi:His/Glu/Gln/Arg/opine family amino acid ABC transporter permease subunit
MLLAGLRRTLIIILFSTIVGFVLGTLLAFGRRSKIKPLSFVCAAIVDILRNTPFLVQLFFIFYGLPQLGIKTNPMMTAIIALGINSSAPNCEVIRSGLMAVKTGYYECSLALGFSQFQTLRYVILPIAIRVAFKPLTSNFVNLVLTSSVAFYIAIPEIMGTAKTISARTGRTFEIYLIILLCYCVVTFLLSFISKCIDRKIAITL